MITAETVNGLTAECRVEVKEKQSSAASLTASLRAPVGTVSPGDSVPFDFQLENMEKVATVVFTFEKDADLEYKDIAGKSGFSSLGVKWDGNTGTAALELSERWRRRQSDAESADGHRQDSVRDRKRQRRGGHSPDRHRSGGI